MTGARQVADGSMSVLTKSGEQLSGFDCVLMAIGRKPAIDGLNLGATDVELDQKSHIIVNELQETSAQSIYAVGDVTGKVRAPSLDLLMHL